MTNHDHPKDTDAQGLPETEVHAATIHAAGAVLWRHDRNEKILIALVHRPRYDDWTLPKGKIRVGEIAPAAAVREIHEETGFSCALGHHIGAASYSYAEQKRWKSGKNPSRQVAVKNVQYFSAQAVDGTFIPNNEVDAIDWMSVEDAIHKLTYATDREIVRKFVLLPPGLHVILLVRHAHAGDAREWSGEDRLRPLSDHGWKQADALSPLLPLFQPEKLFSAPLSRCLQTMQPFVEKTHIPVRREYLFSEAGYWSHAPHAHALIWNMANNARSSVICSQGGVIPDLVQHLAQHSAYRSRDFQDLSRALEDPHSKKGSVWALFFTPESRRRPQLVAADYYPKLT